MKHRPLTNRTEIENIIRRTQVCSVAMADEENQPYVVHMNFGYKDDCFYLHGNPKGKKVEIIKKNPKICISLSTDHELRFVNEEVACSWSMKYRSVIASGKAEIIEEISDKEEALNIIMSHYTDLPFNYSLPALREVMVFKVKVNKLEGRAYGY